MPTYLCPTCDWSYETPTDSVPQHCPHCWRGKLSPIDAPALPPLPAEMLIPFNVSNPTLSASIQTFANGIPFPPQDLNISNLRARLQAVYLPMYLVDAEVEATWQGEAGFNYEVVSHREQYGGQGWQTQQMKETRIRWEPRVGRLKRQYHNIPAPALEEHAQLIRQLGAYDFGASKFYSQVKLNALNDDYQARKEAQQRQLAGKPALKPVGAPATGEPLTGEPLIRLPSRSTADAWPDTLPGFMNAAAEECTKAGQSDHFREFRWQAEYANPNWTQLHLPVYTTYYLDDENRPQPVLINGQTGHLTGKRRASMKRAQTTALWILLAAAVVFGISVVLGLVGVMFPPVLVIGGIGIFVAFIIVLGAIYPVFKTWQFNKQ